MKRRSFFVAPLAAAVTVGAGTAISVNGNTNANTSINPNGLRLSSDDDDPGYALWYQLHNIEGKRIKVFLDGKEHKECTVADEKEGFIVQYRLDNNGHVIIDGDEFVKERLNGKVRIEISPVEKTYNDFFLAYGSSNNNGWP